MGLPDLPAKAKLSAPGCNWIFERAVALALGSHRSPHRNRISSHHLQPQNAVSWVLNTNYDTVFRRSSSARRHYTRINKSAGRRTHTTNSLLAAPHPCSSHASVGPQTRPWNGLWRVAQSVGRTRSQECGQGPRVWKRRLQPTHPLPPPTRTSAGATRDDNSGL
jgi:hypothetical protein